MGRAPCCDKANVKKGPWSPEEDTKLKEYIEKYGTGGNWIVLPQKAGLKRCGKSCRLRWLNYLRPNIKHGDFTNEEDKIICSLFATIGSRWSIIAAQLPGRTDNDIKNYWNTKLKKKFTTIAAAANPTQSQRKPIPTSFLPPSSQSTFSFFTNSYFKKLGFESNNTSTNPTFFLQNHENSVNPAFYPSLKENNGMLVFGSETSCSTSSDGSQIKQEDHHFLDNQNQKFMMSYGGTEELNQWNQKSNGSGNQLDYSIEEVKNLISSSSSGNNNGSLSTNNFWFIDENKTEEKLLYYYNY